MKPPPTLTSADAQRQYLPGELIHLGDGPAWKDILVEIYSRNLVESSMLVPAVAEPQIIWQISGSVLCEERDLGGEWSSHESVAGDIFLTTSPTPYELRWRSLNNEPLVAMHVFIGIPLLAMAAREVLGEGAGLPMLKEAYAVHDPKLNVLLEQLRSELVERGSSASALFVQGVAQSLAVHLVRTFREESAMKPPESKVLPAFRFRKVEMMMLENLERGIQIAELAHVAGMSAAHFSRMFKSTTGLSPLQYFIRQRITKAQQLLRETDRSILEIGFDVGYTSASHFTHVFRKEAGQTPNDYRHAELHARAKRF